jgi:hypothetical protein
MIGTEGWYANAEIRIPLINVASTLIGQIGPIRGTLFMDMARSRMKGQPWGYSRYIGSDPEGNPILIEYDALGSIGFGFQAFLLGMPMHLEFVKRVEWPDIGNPLSWNVVGNWMTRFWIGFDF